MENILPYAYALLVFGIVAFLFVLLGRIFMNVDTVYYYEYERITKHEDKTGEYDDNFRSLVNERGKNGWRLERIEDMKNVGNGIKVVMLIFIKTKSKVKFF